MGSTSMNTDSRDPDATDPKKSTKVRYTERQYEFELFNSDGEAQEDFENRGDDRTSRSRSEDNQRKRNSFFDLGTSISIRDTLNKLIDSHDSLARRVRSLEDQVPLLEADS